LKNAAVVVAAVAAAAAAALLMRYMMRIVVQSADLLSVSKCPAEELLPEMDVLSHHHVSVLKPLNYNKLHCSDVVLCSGHPSFYCLHMSVLDLLPF
jgi:hypothetical protein